MLKTVANSFRLAFLNIRTNFFHTFLSVLGIVIGVASLVGVLSLIDGMELFARDQIAKTTSLNAIEIRPNFYRTVNGIQIRKDSVAALTYQDITKIQLSEPVTLFARVSLAAEVTKIDSGKVIGVRAHASLKNIIPDLKTTAGSLFTSENINRGDSVAIVNIAFIKTIGTEAKDIIGEKIKMSKLYLTIVGVVGEEKDTTPQLYYPFTLLTDKQLKQNPPIVNILVEKTENIPPLKAEVQKWLDDRFPNNKDDFQIVTNDFRVEQTLKGFMLFRVIMGLIVGISVIVGGVGVMNVLLISVTERTSEIGLRKAVGANPRHIALQFLSESVTISAFGSFLGLVLGILGTLVVVPIVKSLTELPFQAAFTWNTIIVISVMAFLVGIVFGTYPALRASRLNPVDAIRHE